MKTQCTFIRLIKQNCHESLTKCSSSTWKRSEIVYHHSRHSTFSTSPWSRVNPHTSLQIYRPSLIWITSCNNLKTLALYHNLSNRRVSSCLVHYSQIHCLGCDSMATFIHVSPAGMFLRGKKKTKNITSIFLLYSTMNTIC